MKKIAIIGQPNVGKSSLFNRLLKQQLAITSDISGTTRDFKKGVVDFIDEDNYKYKDSYEIIDTAGLDKDNIFSKEIKKISIDVANNADIILYMVDGKSISEQEDRRLFFELGKLKKPLALVINKIDNDREKEKVWEFKDFGVQDIFAISVSHNRGITAIQNWIDSFINDTNKLSIEEDIIDDENAINVGIVGRVNVGKSSLLNAIVGYDRSIVSEIAGTTLDPIDERVQFDDKQMVFVDTAGIRRRGKIIGLEKYALMRTKTMLQKTHIAILVLDASEPMNRLDEKICGVIDEFSLGIIIVFNKWDKSIYDFDKLRKEFKYRFKFLEYAPILTVSALSKRNIEKLKEKILEVYEKYSYRISTSKLNDIIQDAIKKHPIPRKNTQSVRILYTTQFQIKPPRILVNTNKEDGLHFSYKRYLVNCIREKVDFEGVPIILEVRKRQSNTKRQDSGDELIY